MPTITINLNINFGSGTVGSLQKAKTVVAGKTTELENSYLSEGNGTLTAFINNINATFGITTSNVNGTGNLTSQSTFLQQTSTVYGGTDLVGIHSYPSSGLVVGRFTAVLGYSEIVSGFAFGESNIYVKSPNIYAGSTAVFSDDGGGNIILISGPAPTVGTVTQVSVSTGNGFAGTVATDTTTPVITLTTTINGLLKGNGTSISAANDSDITSFLITGVSIAGDSIAGTDTMLTAFGKLQNQINGLLGGSIVQGTWNATTNQTSPGGTSLASGVGTSGHYYIVSVAGSTNLDGITDWKVGDWAIFILGTWHKVDNTDAVSSVNGLAGAVALTGTSNRITISGANVFDIGSDVVTLNDTQALTNKTYNGNTFTAGTGTLTISAGKIATFNSTIAFSGTDSTTITMPTVSSTVLANNVGLSGGTTLVGGLTTSEKITIQATSNSTHTSAKDLITLRKNSASAAATSVLMTIGDGQGVNNDEVSIYTGINTGTNGYLLRAGATFAYFNASSSLRLQIAAADIIQLSSTTATMVQGITISDGKGINFNTSTGGKIALSTSQKFAFWNKTPIVQPTTSITGATLVSPGAGTNIKSDDTFGGYTLQQLAAIIINTGLAA